MLPPELNVEKSEQSGLIEDNCTYDYYKMLGHNFIIEIETSNNITIEIYKTNANLNNEKLIYNNTGTYIFANIQLNSSDEFNITHIKIYNSDPKLLENSIDIFDIYPLNNETYFNSNPPNDLYLIGDNNKSNNYSLIITSLVTSLISLTLILSLIIIKFIKCTKCKYKKFSDYDEVN
jgi:asparagine N-glycosylation enzyme membrane subunit Stt3